MKRLLVLLFILLLTACNSSSNNDLYYKELVYTHFETTQYEIDNDTIKITLDNELSYEEIVTRTNLMLNEINEDITIKTYQYNKGIPTIITLYKLDNEISGYKFN
jgi:uncharacterized lipoprotein YmbA